MDIAPMLGFFDNFPRVPSSLRFFLFTLHSLSLFCSYRQRSLLPQSVFTEVVQLCNAGVTLDTLLS